MSSPVIKKKVDLMGFPEAVVKLNYGKKVSRLEWDSRETYLHVADGFLCIHQKGDDALHACLVKDVDLKAVDWIVINEKQTN